MKKGLIRLLALLIMVAISSNSFFYVAYAGSITKNGVTIDVGSSVSPESHIGDTITVTVTIKNDSGEMIPAFRIYGRTGVFNNVDFVDDSVEVDGVPASYLFDSESPELVIVLKDIPDGEERVVTYKGTIIKEGSFSLSHVYSMTGTGIFAGGSTTVNVYPKAYKVIYEANGGTGTAPVESDKRKDDIFTAANNTFSVPEGQVFKEWNTLANGTGDSYAQGAAVTMPDSDLVLYAVWAQASPETTYRVTYQANGGTGTAPAESDKRKDDTFSVANNTFSAPAGQVFKEWNTLANGTGNSYAAGATVTMPGSDLILYAIWENIPAESTYKVTYEANGGTGTAPVESDKKKNDTFSAAENTFAAPKGYKFKEWNTQKDGAGDSYAAGEKVTMPAGDLKLYAIWQKTSMKGANAYNNTKTNINASQYKSVKTSDDSASSVWAMAAAVSGAVMFGLIYTGLKKKRA